MIERWIKLWGCHYFHGLKYQVGVSKSPHVQNMYSMITQIDQPCQWKMGCSHQWCLASKNPPCDVGFSSHVTDDTGGYSLASQALKDPGTQPANRCVVPRSWVEETGMQLWGQQRKLEETSKDDLGDLGLGCIFQAKDGDDWWKQVVKTDEEMMVALWSISISWSILIYGLVVWSLEHENFPSVGGIS